MRCCLLISQIQAFPTEGPRRSFGKLQLLGNGFWNANNIIVKFTFKQAGFSVPGEIPKPAPTPGDVGYIPPRSCSGKFLNTSTLTCKPPKFSEPGLYSVAVSMDGIVFLPNTVEVFIHQELAVQKQQPELLDLSVSPNIAELALVIVKCIILNSRTLTNDLSLNFYFPRLCMYST